jgi:hypothetical protein
MPLKQSKNNADYSDWETRLAASKPLEVRPCRVIGKWGDEQKNKFTLHNHWRSAEDNLWPACRSADADRRPVCLLYFRMQHLPCRHGASEECDSEGGCGGRTARRFAGVHRAFCNLRFYYAGFVENRFVRVETVL